MEIIEIDQINIGIICASDTELEPFLSNMTNTTQVEKSMLKFHIGKIGEVSVVAVYSGVCKTNSAIATQILIDNFKCTHIINSGTSGGMNETIGLFDTIISSEVAYWDVDEGILTEYHPWLDSIYFKADTYLLKLAGLTISKSDLYETMYIGRIVSGESFIEDDFRYEINEHFSPLCVDMESASIAHTCYVNKIPFISVRTVTDTESHLGKKVFLLNCAQASKLSANFVLSMIRELIEDISSK